MKRLVTPFVVLLISALVGCGQSDPAANQSTQSETPQPAAPTTLATEAFQAESPTLDVAPDRIVESFLQALRDGDDTLAESLLTTKAREETAKRNLAVQPPGTPSANFNIGKVEFVTSDRRGAHVNSVWTETDPQGNTISYEIVWALRQQQEGWRIAGMATQVAQSEPPVFLNFEDPDDMLRKWQDAKERLAAEEGDQLR
jgi:hypothetical protein